jgi:hypothetical protein
VVEERGPTLLVDGQVLISGEVPRVTEFETGSPSTWPGPGTAGSPTR